MAIEFYSDDTCPIAPVSWSQVYTIIIDSINLIDRGEYLVARRLLNKTAWALRTDFDIVELLTASEEKGSRYVQQ